MCVWEPVYGVDGPHPYGQWGVYMPNEYVAEVVSWMSANHGEFEVLFHPNTGYMVGGKIHLSFLFDAQVYDREMLRRRHLVQHLEFDVNSQIKTLFTDTDHGSRAIWIKQMVPLDMNFLIWLQCQWFECSLQDTVAVVPK